MKFRKSGKLKGLHKDFIKIYSYRKKILSKKIVYIIYAIRKKPFGCRYMEYIGEIEIKHIEAEAGMLYEEFTGKISKGTLDFKLKKLLISRGIVNNDFEKNLDTVED